MIRFLVDLFSLPAGSIWSNIISSVLLGIVGFIYGRAFEKRAEKRHQELKDHITKTHKS